jgi:hypothetical protein
MNRDVRYNYVVGPVWLFRKDDDGGKREREKENETYFH